MVNDKFRTNVTFTNEQIAKLDSYAHTMGMSRNALIVWFVGQGLFALDKSSKAIDAMSEKLADDIAFGVSQNPRSGG